MNYSIKRRMAYILMAVASSHIWYYLLVDGLSDTPLASLGFSLAQILAIALPFIFCLVWSKERTYNRINFIIVYFFVLGICDYFHSFIYNTLWDVIDCLDISISITTVKSVLLVIMILIRIVFSLTLLRKTYKSLLIVAKFRDE